MTQWLATNLALIMFVAMFFAIFCGFPVAFVMGGLALVFAVLGWMLDIFPMLQISNIVLRMWGNVAIDPILVSIPMFIFMGSILERSGSAKDMLGAMEVMLKRVPGALAVAVMAMGTILAAPMGVVGAAVVTLGDRAAADARLGIRQAACSRHDLVGRNARDSATAGHHAGGDGGNARGIGGDAVRRRGGAGAAAVRAVSRLHHHPRAGAAGQGAEAAEGARAAELARVLGRDVEGPFPMTALLFIVLGSIFAGWATPTESAGVGVAGSMFIAWLNRQMSWKMMNDSIRNACRANGLVFMIFLGATGFAYVFRVLGGDDLMIPLAKLGIETKWEMLAFVMVLIFLLGFPFEWIEICLIVLPIFGPILGKYDFSDHLGEKYYFMAWFGTLVAVNLQTSFMTPPFGATLFYMKGTAPPSITMSDIYSGMYPFVGLQILGLLLCIWFPEIALWLPRAVGFL